MRRSRFTEEQIIGVLREHDGGVKTADLCCRHGISDATFYNWKAKYDGLTVSDAARRRAQPDVDADMAALARMALRTTLSDNRRFRAIAFIGLPRGGPRSPAILLEAALADSTAISDPMISITSAASVAPRDFIVIFIAGSKVFVWRKSKYMQC